MVVRESFEGIAQVKESLGEVELVVDEPTTLVYQKGGKFGFVQFVDAKGPPELEGGVVASSLSPQAATPSARATTAAPANRLNFIEPSFS